MMDMKWWPGQENKGKVHQTYVETEAKKKRMDYNKSAVLYALLICVGNV